MIFNLGFETTLFFSIPFNKKDEIKKYGCYWNPKIKLWGKKYNSSITSVNDDVNQNQLFKKFRCVKITANCFSEDMYADLYNLTNSIYSKNI